MQAAYYILLRLRQPTSKTIFTKQTILQGGSIYLEGDESTPHSKIILLGAGELLVLQQEAAEDTKQLPEEGQGAPLRQHLPNSSYIAVLSLASY